MSSIESKCWLSIGNSRIQTPETIRPTSKWVSGENSADGIASTIPGRERWHRERCLFFQQCHESRDIIGFPCLHIAREQRARRALLEDIEAGIGGNRVQPGTQRP